MEKVKQFINNLEKEDKLIVLTTIILGFINFFYLLTHNVLSPDGLAFGPIYKSNGWEVDLGRPFLLIVDRLRGGIVAPPIIIFTSLIIISISTILLRRIFQIKKTIPTILLATLVSLFPVLSESALFIYCFDSYSLALLFSILGIYFIKKEKPLFAIGSIITSLSLYQAYISITITGVFALYIIDLLEDKDTLKQFIKNIFIVFLGLLSYLILLKVGMLVFGRQMASYKGANSFGINTILSLPKSILHAYCDYFSFFWKENIIFNQYFKRNIINILFMLLFFIMIIIQMKHISIKNKLLLSLSIILFPIATNIMDLIACDTRINLVTGIGFLTTYVLQIIVFTNYIKKEELKALTYLIFFILTYTYLLSNNGTFMAREDTYNNYFNKSIQYLNKATQLKDYDKSLPWMFTDIIRYNSNLVTVSNGYLAKDNETYDNYFGVDETSIFFDHYLGERISVVDLDTYHKITKTEEFQEMKLEEVKIIDSIIVVKTSENTPY